MRSAPRTEAKITSDLDKWLDENPCKHCDRHYDAHHSLTPKMVDDAREHGYTVQICEDARRNLGCGSNDVLFCVVTPPPDDPCDSDFMEEISS